MSPSVVKHTAHDSSSSSSSFSCLPATSVEAPSDPATEAPGVSTEVSPFVSSSPPSPESGRAFLAAPEDALGGALPSGGAPSSSRERFCA